MAMKFRPKQSGVRNAVQLNLPSMIDVVFLLLIFFLFSSIINPSESQLTPGIQSQSAEGASSGRDFAPQVVLVEMLDGAPVYRIGSRVMRDRRELASVLRDLPRELGVFVRVDDAVPVGFAVSAIQVCRDAGYTKVTYVPKGR